MANELEVKNLRISFRTNNGLVRAVRDISFDLKKGETIAIVGESGSGKSVTAKAIMGILAGNSIVESGEIIYKGENLLSYSDKDMDKIRGNKITMIFQDPMSSLDPIMKVGRQMTEAALINGKANQKAAKKEYRALLQLLKKTMQQAGCPTARTEALLKQYEELLQRDSAKYKQWYDENNSARGDIAEPELYIMEPAAKAELLGYVKAALAYSSKQCEPQKQQLPAACRQALGALQAETLDKAECEKAFAPVYKLVERSIDALSIHKNSAITTYKSSMERTFARYFDGVRSNPRELARAEAEAKKAKNGKPAVPPVLVDLELTRQNLIRTTENLIAVYEASLSGGDTADYDALALELLAHLQKLSFAMVNRITKAQARADALRIMEDVGIKEPEKRFNQYPFEFSGGMRQRIVIAIAIAANPDVLICDEPTTALDVTIQAQIMELINEVKRKRQLSVVFITHDLGVVANMADKVAVMYAGKIVETGTVDDIFYRPAHPYTWALLASMPDLDTKGRLEAIPGTPPNMIYPPVGDAFAERNKYAMAIDFKRQPPMFKISDTHFAATWLLHPDAPKVDPPKSVTERIERMKKRTAKAEV